MFSHRRDSSDQGTVAGSGSLRRLRRVARAALAAVALAGISFASQMVSASSASAAVSCPQLTFGSWLAATGGGYGNSGTVTADALAKTCANGNFATGPENFSIIGAIGSPVTGPSAFTVMELSFNANSGGVQKTLTATCSGSCSASGGLVTIVGTGAATASVSYTDVTGQTVTATIGMDGSTLTISAFSIQGGAYDATGPVVSTVAPNSGWGGTSVTLTGGKFTGATAVKFGSTPAQSFSVGSPSSITAVAPVAAVGPVSISVTSPAGTSTLANAFTYVLQPQAPVTVTASPAVLAVGGTSTISASGGSGSGAITFATVGTTCSLTGNILTANIPGTCNVTATKAADATYVAGGGFTTVTVSKLNQAPLTATTYPADIAIGQMSTVVVSGGTGTGAISRIVTNGIGV